MIRCITAVPMIGVVVFAATALAQHAGHKQSEPYTELTARHIMTRLLDLMADLQAGRGIGLPVSAELMAQAQC